MVMGGIWAQTEARHVLDALMLGALTLTSSIHRGKQHQAATAGHGFRCRPPASNAPAQNNPRQREGQAQTPTRKLNFLGAGAGLHAQAISQDFFTSKNLNIHKITRQQTHMKKKPDGSQCFLQIKPNCWLPWLTTNLHWPWAHLARQQPCEKG